MLRAVIGVIVGYAVVFILVMISFTIAYIAMGTEGAFKDGSYEVSLTWLITSFVIGLVAAIIAGFTCAVIAEPGSKATLVLAGIVLVVGLGMALPVLISAADDAEPPVREGSVPNFEAMQKAEQPVIAAILNPVIGAAGVLIGWRIRGPGETTAKPLPANSPRTGDV